MDPNARFVITPRTVLGLSIALLGVLMTLDRLFVLNVEHIFRYYWPVPIMLMGGLMIVQATDTHERVRGVFFALVGTWLFLSMQGLIRVRIWDLFWPAMLILIGISMALRSGPPTWRRHRLRRWRAFGPEGPFGPAGPFGPHGPLGPNGPLGAGRKTGSTASSSGSSAFSSTDGGEWSAYAETSDRMSIFAVLSGSRRASSAQDFKGGDITAIMGGAQLDLRLAAIPSGKDAVLDVTAVMGGVEIFVPPYWEVATPILPFLGGVQDDRLPAVHPDHLNQRAASGRLVIRGFVMMGGVHIKS